MRARQNRPRFQMTLERQIIFEGFGLHSGAPVTMRLCPAAANHGVRFLRSDLSNGARLIFPSADSVSQTQLCTNLENDQGGSVGTIEHLMAALHAAGLSNVLIEINGPEVPILDGSSEPMLSAILSAGLVSQSERQTYIRVKKSVKITRGEKSVDIQPHKNADDTRLLIDFDINFDTSCIGQQAYSFDLTVENFNHELSAARTFGFLEQLEALQEQGLAKGGNARNAIIVSQGTVTNPEGLRFENEFVRHKALDAVGDLFIQGLPVIGKYKGSRAGHEMTNLAMRALMSNPDNFEYIQI